MSPLSLSEIRQWLELLARRRRFGEPVPSISEVADRSGLSRQTVYSLLRDERSEFGERAQIRLSHVIRQISADPSFIRSRLLSIKMTTNGPLIKLSGH